MCLPHDIVQATFDAVTPTSVSKITRSLVRDEVDEINVGGEAVVDRLRQHRSRRQRAAWTAMRSMRSTLAVEQWCTIASASVSQTGRSLDRDEVDEIGVGGAAVVHRCVSISLAGRA